FDIDRIEEGHMEFNVSRPKDRVRMDAFKEKSPYTVIHYGISFKAKEPRNIYKYDRDDDILKARVKVDADVITVYPGGEPISFLPYGTSEWPESRTGFTGLAAEEKNRFERSQLYKILVGIWYNKIYAKDIEKYEKEAEETIIRIHNLMREKFGIEKTIARTGASQYRRPWK
ncbi:MAG: hypothetical protein BRC26_02445, partial [Nanohaloarchaea archaeon QH_8_44_6]